MNPCFDPAQQSKSPGEQFYLPELARGGCTTETNTNLRYDPRYTDSGLHTDLYTVQNENGVLSILRSSPDYRVYVPSASQKSTDYISSWNRPTLNWSLTCEADGKSRSFAIETVQDSIASSDKIVQFRKLGISMCVFYSIFMTLLCCGCPPALKDGSGTQVALAGGLLGMTRFC